MKKIIIVFFGFATVLSALPVAATTVGRGQEYSDPTFGTIIRRLSDAGREGSTYVSRLYSSVNPFNADANLILLEKSGVVPIRTYFIFA